MTTGDRPGGDWAGRTVLVTGCGGFLGGRLARALGHRSARVLGLIQAGAGTVPAADNAGDAAGFEPVAGDVRDIDSLAAVFREHRVSVVFHLAALASPSLSRGDPLRAFEVNTRGTWNLLEACRTAGSVPKVVLASSDSVYGESDGSAFTEAMAISPGFPYEASKACAEIAARCYVATYGMQVAIARFCNIYGPGDTTQSRLIVSTIEAALTARRMELHGDGSSMRNYLYVDDAVTALIGVAERLGDGAFADNVLNICDDTPYSVLDIVRRVFGLTGQEALTPILGSGAHGEISIKFASAAKARDLLGWRPGVSLDEGLRRTIAWHRDRMARVTPG